MSDLNHGIAVGEAWYFAQYDGLIFITDNGGGTWTFTGGGNSILRAVSSADVNNITAVGDGGVILRSTNGGLNWVPQSSGTGIGLVAVSCPDVNNAIAVGYNGTIIRTTDGGTTWIKQSSGTTYDLYGVSFTDANNGTTVGGNGTILRTTNGGVTFISKENNIPIPQRFILSQNYPNPFNPNTVISYLLPSASNLKLIVYNTLGQSVKTLENNFKQAGNYTINFNASDLPSGIYFYQLEAGQLSLIKK